MPGRPFSWPAKRKPGRTACHPADPVSTRNDSLSAAVAAEPLILVEAAVNERLRRTPGLELHPRLEHSPLIYSDAGRDAMRRIYHEYLQLAGRAGLPILLQTPTWRANRDRVQDSGVPAAVNRDASRFMRGVIDTAEGGPDRCWLAGVIGCRNDCYRPDESLTAAAAERFHRWQIDRLASAGVDCLFAATLPAVEEALGIARAMQTVALPYFLSFVIGPDGRVLDGTPLDRAITLIDGRLAQPPTAYFVNCAYPAFLNAGSPPKTLFKRLLGFQGNASAMAQCELDGCQELRAERVEDWGEAMLQLHFDHGIRLLGGCCGTDARHLEYLAGHRRR